jgi:hypothetical protein
MSSKSPNSIQTSTTTITTTGKITFITDEMLLGMEPSLTKTETGWSLQVSLELLNDLEAALSVYLRCQLTRDCLVAISNAINGVLRKYNIHGVSFDILQVHDQIKIRWRPVNPTSSPAR